MTQAGLGELVAKESAVLRGAVAAGVEDGGSLAPLLDHAEGCGRAVRLAALSNTQLLMTQKYALQRRKGAQEGCAVPRIKPGKTIGRGSRGRVHARVLTRSVEVLVAPRRERQAHLLHRAEALNHLSGPTTRLRTRAAGS